ncbi:hypothetical protein H6761_02650 [Candidatus Nomurabacteria bacterium]|nr:hypothetical protein [Candidatus Nomurabacteria bacterium]
MHKSKKFLVAMLLAIFLVGPVIVFNPKPALALSPDVVAVNSAKWIWEKISAVVVKVKDTVLNQVIENTARMYLNNLAYNIASSIAEGAEGGKPLFRTDSIKDSLRKSQEAAIGEFIGTLTEGSFSDLGFNLCDPSIEVKLTLTLGLIDTEAPPEPKCNWREVQKNWSQFSGQIRAGQWQDFLKVKLDPRYGSVDDWKDFWIQFDLSNSDLGTALTLVGALDEQKAQARLLSQISSSECQGFLDSRTTVTNEVKTHCLEIMRISEAKWDLAFQGEAEIAQHSAKGKISWSSVLKDAGNLFMNTLSSKLLKLAVEKGMRQINSWYAQDGDFRTSLLDQLRGGGDLRRAPRGADVFRDLITVDFGQVENYSVLENFAICPDQVAFRHPDNCVISAEFLQTIGQKKTIGDLIDQGLLNPNTPFIGPNDPRNNSDDCYQDGFCYHNLVKLRKANVVPVGWEFAAQRSPAGEAVTLGEAIACFEDETGCPYGIDPSVDEQHNPYYHLIDPNWVLKLPPARCEALVYAPTLESNQSNTRQEYCADVSTCLREDDQGNCLDGQYGYCTLSENIWRLDGDLCEDGDIYSGCLTFEGNNSKESYLEQSLDYCTADEAGCLRYSQEKDDAGDWVLTDIASDSNDLFLNDKSANCPSNRAGCEEFIVMAASRGINLLPNGNFDYYQGTANDGVNDTVQSWNLGGAIVKEIVNDAYLGKTALKFNQNVSTNFDTGLALKNRTFILSFYAKAPSAGTNLTFRISAGADSSSRSEILVPEWRPYQIVHTFASDIENTSLGLSFVSASNVLMDAMKLEEVGATQTTASTFTNYGDGGRIFMDDERVMCLAEEVGCQGYFPENNDPMVPGIISAGDICPAECVGYSSFAQSPNNFDLIEGDIDTEYYNFIPDTALSCPLSEVGCEEFTNLDEVAAGGEGKEYYSYLRQCVPLNADNVGTYYTWEGSDVAGYQLKTWTFLKSNLDDAPCTDVEVGTNTCVDITPAACGPETPANPFDDPIFDPNCREFFDIEGNSHYRLQDKVIYASDQCSAYRRTATGQEYQAIADLSYSCQAQNAGCRVYEGEAANNLHRIFLDNFENGSYSPWTGAGLNLSNESLANNGHSLKAGANATIQRSLPEIQSDKIFQVSWWMKNTGNLNSVRAVLYDGDAEHEIGIIGPIGFGDWRLYQISSVDNLELATVDNVVLRLQFSGSGEVFLDNVILKEVEESLSFVKDSWKTPVSCDTPFTGAYLGCQAYTDTNNNDYNLKSFSSLCREEAIGCMAVIDTQNSESPFAETFHIDDYSRLDITADTVSYLVPDRQHYCPEAYKGCSALGLPQVDQANNTIETYSTVYKINDPDNYQNTLCTSDALYCQAYNSDKGSYYFKDPGNRNCTYQKNVNLAGNIVSGWFKTASLETAAPESCSPDGNFTLAPTWAASCPAEKNLCTEFRDPLDPSGCDVEVEGSCQSYYYYNNDKIDESSCNGQFDQNSGCILLYEANNWNGEHSEVITQYDAVASYQNNLVEGRPVNPESGDNANVLVKVRKDRQCAEWLSCKSSTAVFDEQTSSYKIICDAIDSCTEYSDANNITQCAQWSTYTDAIPLTIVEYQDRATSTTERISWPDKEYLGYSIPEFFPVQDLKVYNFSQVDTETDLRLVYESDVTCTAAEDLASCSALGYTGTCKDQICWLNPDASDDILHLDTRAYAQQDAPYANRIRADKESTVQFFANANICETGDNDCELKYKKITYGLGGFVKYFGNKNADTTSGVCTIIGDDPEDGRVEGSLCVSDGQCGDNTGKCTLPTKIETFLNWPGICLETDASTAVPIDELNGVDIKNYCNQWYPVDEIQGAQSLYNNFTTAGFYSDTGADLEMCAVSDEFITLEDRYYCGSTENGFGDDSGSSCTVLLKVPAGSKININKAESFGSFIDANYLNEEAFTFNDSVQALIRDDSNATCGGENANTEDRRECINDGAFFQASDFGEISFDNIVIHPDDLALLFDGVAGNIEYYYFDEAVKGDGTWNLDEGASGSDNDKVLANGAEFYSDGFACDNWHVEVCPAGTHQVEVRDWRGNSHCGFYGERKQYGQRYCNPLTYNYYLRADSSSADLTCTETNCAEPTYGRACLNTKATYNGITIPAAGCGSDLNCQFKQCIEALSDPLATPYCSEYGEVTYNESYDPVSGDWVSTPSSITGCLATILQISGTNIVAKAGVNASLVSEAQSCLESGIEDACVAAAGYQVEKFSTDCTGLDCLQQCQTISQVAAEGDDDRSWVRTDIWWRSSENPTLNRGWSAWYYDNLIYSQSNQAYLQQIAGIDMNKYFGSAHNSVLSQPVTTKTPLNIAEGANQVSIFFSDTDFDTAKSRMKYLFAKVYNLQWDPSSGYQFSAYPEINDATNVNPDAGPDYPPKIYQVCGDSLCPGDKPGITINNQNNANIVGRGDLFTDIKFYYYAHPDHMPVTEVQLDPYGDGGFTVGGTGKYKNNMPSVYCDPTPTGFIPGSDVYLMGFSGLSRACHVGYKSFYQQYSYDPIYACGDIENASCYTPQVRVVDNWGETTTISYPGRIVIYQD